MKTARDTSPGAAIKIAYDYARALRRTGAVGEDLESDVFELVETPHRDDPLLRYLRAGFIAGYRGVNLPWVKEIDALEAITRISRGPDIASVRR